MSVSGDGGFLFACGELATAAQERIPLTAVVVDDGGYGMLRFDQDRRGDPHEGVDLVTPDFAALAGSFGVRAEAVDGPRRRVRATRSHATWQLDEPSMLVARASIGPAPEHVAALVQGRARPIRPDGHALTPRSGRRRPPLPIYRGPR